MKKFGGKFALIIGLTLLGLISIWPPKDKLKTGIDLSGGTILVYEVNPSSTAAGNRQPRRPDHRAEAPAQP